MLNYIVKTVSNIKDKTIDIIYKELLQNKFQFIILKLIDNSIYVLTKEKSLFKIENEEEFLKLASKDIYYKTVISNENIKINKDDFKLYKYYIDKYKNKIMQKKYNDKYYFGCVAVKTDNGFITTTRGKESFEEYSIVKNVNHKEHIINVINKKASLNAPLLDYLFKNPKVKAIVHLHEFDDTLPYYEYAFPGTVRDTIRNNTQSFNIRHHGLIYIFE
ncbi:MAG: hypothetical protein HFJ60_03135 [Clostridia bacterium]|jgi:hypothetical protein|nr:hypothetical protein [Clostridia bacterium]